MLVREKNSILQAVTRGWGTVYDRDKQVYNMAITAIRDSYASDVRVEQLRVALTDFGIGNPDQVINGWLGTPSLLPTAKSGLVREMREKVATVPPVKTPMLYTDPCYGELDIALSTVKAKWGDIQTSVYLLIADMNGATDYETCRMAIRTFTKSIA